MPSENIEHPKIRPMTSEIKEEKLEKSMPPRGVYWGDESLIALYVDDHEEAATVVDHEYMHHILDRFVCEEVSKKFDKSGLGYYLDHLLSPRNITCLYCKHYIPSSVHWEEGGCEKHGKNVRCCERCPDSELHPIYKKLPFYEFDNWTNFRCNGEPLSSLYKLTESDSDEVREYYLEVLKKRADFYRDHPDQFRLNCKNLGSGECDPAYCKEECPGFEGGRPEIFSYLEEGESLEADEYSTPVENSEEAV